MAFLTGQSWRALKSLYTGGNLEQRLRRCFADGLNRSLVSSVAQATNGLVTPSLDNNVMPYRDRPLLLEGKTNQALHSVTYSFAINVVSVGNSSQCCIYISLMTLSSLHETIFLSRFFLRLRVKNTSSSSVKRYTLCIEFDRAISRCYKTIALFCIQMFPG